MLTFTKFFQRADINSDEYTSFKVHDQTRFGLFMKFVDIKKAKIVFNKMKNKKALISMIPKKGRVALGLVKPKKGLFNRLVELKIKIFVRLVFKMLI